MTDHSGGHHVLLEHVDQTHPFLTMSSRYKPNGAYPIPIHIDVQLNTNRSKNLNAVPHDPELPQAIFENGADTGYRVVRPGMLHTFLDKRLHQVPHLRDVLGRYEYEVRHWTIAYPKMTSASTITPRTGEIVWKVMFMS